MRFCAVAALALALSGCAATPAEYRDSTEIPAGPGLFTGAAGAFSLKPDEPVAPRNEAEWQEFREWRAWKRQQAGASR
jgi:hypothetical protein